MEQAWEENRSFLFNFIKLRVDEKDVAADLLQEVGLKFFQAAKTTSSIENPKAWLFKTTRNTIADHYRSISRKETAAPFAQDLPNEDEPCVCDLTSFIIEKYLPEKYAFPLQLSDLDNMPQSEIAQLLNLNLSTTKSRIQRARMKLKEIIEDWVDLRFNENGQVADIKLSADARIPSELLKEIERLKIQI